MENKTAFKISDFIFEMVCYPYSKDYFDMLLESNELKIRDKYFESYQLRGAVEDFIIENGIVLSEEYLPYKPERIIYEASFPNGQSLFNRVSNFIKTTWRKFFLGMKRIFLGIKEINPNDSQSFRDALKNNSFDKEIIDKVMNIPGVSSRFWIDLQMPITDPDVKNIVFASGVGKITQESFKKFCMLVLTKEPIRLNARELSQIAMTDKKQQQAFDLARSEGKLKPTSFEAVANFFSGSSKASTKEELERVWKKYVEEQKNVEINGIVFQFSGEAADKNIANMNEVNKNIQSMAKRLDDAAKLIKDSKPDGTVEIMMPDGSTRKMRVREADNFISRFVDLIKNVAPSVGAAMLSATATVLLKNAVDRAAKNIFNDKSTIDYYERSDLNKMDDSALKGFYNEIISQIDLRKKSLGNLPNTPNRNSEEKRLNAEIGRLEKVKQKIEDVMKNRKKP